jgi:hypothetical protein
MRRNVTVLVLIGVLVPPALAGLGYLVAGSPHVDCDNNQQTAAFYRVAAPFFVLAGLTGAAALVLIARTRGDEKRHWFAESLAVLTALVALSALLPGGLSHGAEAVVLVLAIFTLFTWFITWPVSLWLLVLAGMKLVRRRHHRTPDRSERRIYLALIGWLLATTLPALVVGLSLNADPICFSF